MVCWGKSRDWKLILMAVFERGQARRDFSAFGVVLLEIGPTAEKRKRSLVMSAATRLGIEKLVWLE